jgi:hypothetical protein
LPSSHDGFLELDEPEQKQGEEHARDDGPFERQTAMERRADDAVDHLDVDPVDEERRKAELPHR